MEKIDIFNVILRELRYRFHSVINSKLTGCKAAKTELPTTNAPMKNNDKREGEKYIEREGGT